MLTSCGTVVFDVHVFTTLSLATLLVLSVFLAENQRFGDPDRDSGAMLLEQVSGVYYAAVPAGDHCAAAPTRSGPSASAEFSIFP